MEAEHVFCLVKHSGLLYGWTYLRAAPPTALPPAADLNPPDGLGDANVPTGLPMPAGLPIPIGFLITTDLFITTGLFTKNGVLNPAPKPNPNRGPMING
jgi:hypothetical protein